MTAPLSIAGVRFTDDEFVQAVRWRLGVETRAGVCQLATANAAECCGAELCPHARHAAVCPRGPLRVTMHNEYADVLADIISEAGAASRRGVYVREFVVTDPPASEDSRLGLAPQAAILDVW